jgi:hypothetical protein
MLTVKPTVKLLRQPEDRQGSDEEHTFISEIDWAGVVTVVGIPLKKKMMEFQTANPRTDALKRSTLTDCLILGFLE